MSEQKPIHIYDALKEDALAQREEGDTRPLEIEEIFDVLFGFPRRTPAPQPTEEDV